MRPEFECKFLVKLVSANYIYIMIYKNKLRLWVAKKKTKTINKATIVFGSIFFSWRVLLYEHIIGTTYPTL